MKKCVFIFLRLFLDAEAYPTHVTVASLCGELLSFDHQQLPSNRQRARGQGLYQLALVMAPAPPTSFVRGSIAELKQHTRALLSLQHLPSNFLLPINLLKRARRSVRDTQ